MAEPVVEVRGLRRVFSGRGGGADNVAVDDVSFALAAGEALALVGESGSGKTTTARCIVGLEVPDAGEIVVCGEAREAKKAKAAVRRAWAKQTQMVFQDPYGSLDPRQTIRQGLVQLVKFHRSLSGDEIDSTVRELLELVHLDEAQGDSRPRALSGGQRQRASIAMALIASPKVLILDEAVAALDVSVQAQVLNVLVDIQRATDVALLFLTHDLAVVRQIADAVIVMKSGRVVERGSVEDVLDRPKSEYARRLIASVPRPGWNPADVGRGRQDVAQT